MSKSKPCTICGQRRPVMPINGEGWHAHGVVCPKCGHHEFVGANPLWAQLFYSLPIEKQAMLLGVAVKDLSPAPPEYRKPIPIDKVSA
jgi:hypothetical protein